MAVKKQNLKILFLDILTDDLNLRKNVEKLVYGGKTYSEHVRKVFGLSENEWLTIDASKEKFPSEPDFDAIVIGGSAKDPVRGNENHWMKQTYKFIKKAVKKDIPILGICGGLQFVVRAFGGEIIYNPKGKEFGAINVKILKSDPLFRGLKDSFIVPSNHRCMVGKFSFSAVILGSSEMCPVQAMAIGDKIRLVQFHPERTREQNLILAKMSKESLLKDGIISGEEEYEGFLNSLMIESEAGKVIIGNFLNYFVYPQLSCPQYNY